MRKHRIIVLLGLLIFMGLASCSTDEVDTERPVIQLNEPADHAHFHPGDEIHFDAEFSDNVALKQFKIDIHWGAGHDHKSGQDDDHGHEWSFEHIGELQGRNQHIHMHIDIPEDAKPGEYHFLVYCTDEAGNESFVAIEIEIEDDEHDD
jgi:hypothetical protein